MQDTAERMSWLLWAKRVDAAAEQGIVVFAIFLYHRQTVITIEGVVSLCFVMIYKICDQGLGLACSLWFSS